MYESYKIYPKNNGFECDFENIIYDGLESHLIIKGDSEIEVLQKCLNIKRWAEEIHDKEE